MIENADNMYNILFKDPEIIRRSIVNKNYISLGCLLLVGRKYQKNNTVLSYEVVPQNKIYELKTLRK
jgi:hypothetical protein